MKNMFFMDWFYFENGYWKLLAEILVEINKNILDLVFIIFCLNRNE